jgi:hypothetical protein
MDIRIAPGNPAVLERVVRRMGCMALALFAMCSSASPIPEQPPAPPEVLKVLKTAPFTGEPYELQGKRIVFTDWHLIRPGVLLWLNKDGKYVNTRMEPPYDPWEVRVERPSSPYGIEIVAQPAQAREPLEPERPWETNGLRFHCVIQDGAVYKAWGSCEPGGSCYFESKDGIRWSRPNLGVREFAGSKENNLLASGPAGAVFIDPGAPAAERYKSVGTTSLTWEQFEVFRKKHPDRWENRAIEAHGEEIGIMAICGAVSADGINWTPLPEPFTVEKSDGQQVGYFDAGLREYVVFVRNWWAGPRSERWAWDGRETWQGEKHGSGRRSIGRMTSRDFRNFELSRNVIVPMPDQVAPTEVFYLSTYTTIPNAPDHHLILPTIWDTRSDTTSIGLWSSADGLLWGKVPGPRLCETTAFGDRDGGCIFGWPGLIERADGSFALPYEGDNLPHKYPRAFLKRRGGFLVWPKGRIVAVEAKELGEFTTVGIMPPGKTLRINALTQRAGGIRVEIATLLDEPIPGRTFADCKPVQGNQFGIPVTWNGLQDMGCGTNQPIIIRFKMDRAKLFGIQFE